MRNKTFLTILLTVIGFVALSQPASLPLAYSATKNVSYVRTWQATAPESNPNTLTTRPLRDVKQTTQYIDGLGRIMQTVSKQSSYPTNGTAVDMVSAVVYDQQGRQQYKYLAFAAGSTGGNTSVSDGLFKLNPFQQQAAFYNTQLTGQTSETNIGTNQLNWAYTQATFETSPLSRTMEVFAPGNAWVGTSSLSTEASRRSSKLKYFNNTATDDVRIWNVNNSGTTGVFGTYTSPGEYPAGTLYKTITVDENNKQVIEFKDKSGRSLLKKLQLTAAADDGVTGSGHSDWLCTYYLYDDLGNLRCVIQPRGVELISATWVLTDPVILAEQCFRYEYDLRNRPVMKKIPGAGETYFVYDMRDRLAMTQDANLRATNQWLVTLYDALNRPVQTGLLLNTYNTPAAPKIFAQHLSDAAANSAGYPFTTSTLPSTTYWEYLSKTGYDSYTSIPAASSLTSAYDISYNSYLTAGSSSPDYGEAVVTSASSLTKNMVTWTETKVLGSSPAAYTYTVILYDGNGRPIQVKSRNIRGGADIVTTQYNWSGQPLITVTKQEKAGTSSQTTVIVTRLTYDDLGRAVKTEKRISNTQVNSNAMSAYSTLSTQEYDALGQLKKKTIGSKKNPANQSYYSPRQQLANLDYEYNVRGWLLSINRGYITSLSNLNQYFGMQLGYDKDGALGTFTNKQYTGNVAGVLWKAEGDQQKRKYDFTYDAVNRLMTADFNQYTGAVFDKTAQVDFSVQMGNGTTATLAYDANGNIKAMKQWGLKINTSPVIDEFTYNYFSTSGIENSNKLLAVTESVAINTTDNKLGDFTDKNRTLDDYTYDANGNLVADKNKSISSITYNHLNLPKIISVTGKGTITYSYDASGAKQTKVTAETLASFTHNGTTYTNVAVSTTTLYLDGAVYESKQYTNNTTLNTALGYMDKLQILSHEEGRIRAQYNNTASPHTLTAFAFDYMLKDHLGNVRTLLTEDVQRDIYPAATLEDQNYNGGTARAKEAEFYNINTGNIVAQNLADGMQAQYNNNIPIPNNNPYSNTAASSAWVYKLNAATNTIPNKTGLGIVIKVMAGDIIEIYGKSYHKKPVGNYTAPINPLSVLNIMDLLAGTSMISSKGVTGSQISSAAGFPTTIASLLSNPPAQSSTTPRAGINWVVLDEQFKWVSGGADMVATDGGAGTVKPHALQPLSIPKNGYIYVYCSNESQYNVFFDNLQVVQNRGAILEETSYYPFGLVMSGISSKAAGMVENKLKYNGKELECKEFSDGSGLEWTNYGARMYDHQIGRWHCTDGKAELYFATSPYVYALNQPTNAIDPDGNLVIFINGNHFGFSAPGAGYWRQTITNTIGGYESVPCQEGTRQVWRTREVVTHNNFDERVMNQLGDNHTPRYYDGSNGGWHPLVIMSSGANTAKGRDRLGHEQGERDAKIIIDNLERDKSGNVIETIKIVTHSMGGAYGKGFVRALKEYIATLPIEQQKQIMISMVADFDPFQAGDIKADGDIKTTQYKHKGNGNIGGMGFLANEDEQGLDKSDIKTNTGNSTDHSIFTFLNDITSLAEGTYKWDGSKWIKQ